MLVKLVDAAKFYKELPHQVEAWNWLEKQLTSQELEEFANKFAEGDAHLNDIVNQIPLKRYNAKLQYNPKFVLRNDVESLYDYFDSIEDSSQESNDK
jgi:hypothetical protein